MKTVEYTITQGIDSRGHPEEFTNDAYLTLPESSTSHLGDDGLPAIGSSVSPGLLLIGRFGTTASYRKEDLPGDLEAWSEDEATMISRYGHMFYDASLYVPDGIFGTVRSAYFEKLPDGRLKAVVRVEVSDEPIERCPALNHKSADPKGSRR